MTSNSKKLLFLSTMLMGTILSISSNSWMGVWIGLEINLLSFIPLLSTNKNMKMNESPIKYFIIQALASTALLISILLILMKYPMNWEENVIPLMMISSSLLLKMGAAPFHFWFPEVINSSSWINCLILMTWQKIAPLMVLSYCIKMNIFILLITSTSIIIGALMGLNQTSLRQIMAYSSISHLGWMIGSMMVSESLWELYFITYFLLTTSLIFLFSTSNIFQLNQIQSSSNIKTEIKFGMILSLLSLGGLPPFLGFMPKWMVMQLMIENSLTSLMIIMIMFTIITLYYYIRVSFSALIMMYTENSWSINIKIKPNMIILPLTTMISLFGLILLPMMNQIY